jgi:predicted Fe-S protein YdhL (DUF1289 family)
MPASGDARADSPCIGICRLDESGGLCIGCFRTLREIGAWGGLGRDERRRIAAVLPERRRRAQVAGLSGVGVPGAGGTGVDGVGVAGAASTGCAGADFEPAGAGAAGAGAAGAGRGGAGGGAVVPR